jgi:hypothetical protein
LEKNLQEKNAQIIKLLKDGTNKEVLESVFQKYFPEDQIPESIIEIYSWHNGVELDGVNSIRLFYLFPRFFLNTIESVQEIIDLSDFYDFRRNKLFPLFSSGHGEYLAIDIISGKIIYCSVANIDLETFTTIYDSFSSFLQTINYCYENNIYCLDNKSLLTSDLRMEIEISKQYNNESEFWKIIS